MKALGIFRGFPGLGRVVSGIEILETLRDQYGFEVEVITYLQGKTYLESRGYNNIRDVVAMDYCSIGILPTNSLGQSIHEKIKSFSPNIVIVDGEPLMIQSIKISHPSIKIVTILNPADVENPNNDLEAMEYFNSLYSMADLAIVHGIRSVSEDNKYYNNIHSINTILRKEIVDLQIAHNHSKNIYCVLGGGTVNVGHQFALTTTNIANLCKQAAIQLPEYNVHIICSSNNIYDTIAETELPPNVYLEKDIICPKVYYSNAKLIVTRSGRNTLSELAYLGIPAISFVTGDKYRQHEQLQNLRDLKVSNIAAASENISVNDFVSLIKKQISARVSHNGFVPGNEFAIRKILNICE